MKDELIEMLEELQAQVMGRIPVDDVNQEAWEITHKLLKAMVCRLQTLEINSHNRELKEAGIQLGDY